MLDEIPDLKSLNLVLNLNNECMQTSNTIRVIFSFAEIIEHLLSFMTLHPGNIRSPRTPAGVVSSKQPAPLYLREGDVIELRIDGLRMQKQYMDPEL